MLNRIKLFLPLFLLLTSPLFGQASIEWERYYDTVGANYGNHVIQTSDGGYLVTGGANSSPSDMDVFLLKVDSLGNVQWEKKYGGAGTDAGVASQELPNGDFLVAAQKDNFSETDFWLLKINSIGDTIWTKTISAGIGANEPYSLALTNDSGCVISGYTSAIGSGNYDAMIVKCDRLGNVQWLKVYGGGGADEANSVKQMNDGHYLIGGRKEDTVIGNYDAYVLYLDSIGDTLWTRTFGDINFDRAMGVVEANNGDLILGGYSYSNMESRCKYFISSYSILGTQQWFKTYGYGTQASCFSINLNSNGNYFLFGSVYETTNPNYDFCMIKTDSNGDSLWSTFLGTASADYGYSSALTLDNGYIMAGQTYSFPSLGGNVYLIKTDSLGNVPLGIQYIISNPQEYSIYPNPANDFFNLNIPNAVIISNETKIEVYNTIGQKIIDNYIRVEKSEIETNNWLSGIYFIRISQNEKTIFQNKIIIQH